MLLFATSAFGNELVDRTLGYLALKPIARWRIVLPKLAAAFVVGGLPVAASGFLAVSLVDGALGGALATGAGLLLGAAAYAALFTWAGLATRHALLIGLVYVFVWEATLAAYLDGVRFLSIRRYTLAVIHGLDSARLATIENPLSAGAAVVAAAIVIVGCTALAVRKLARMDVP
jgi:ABC-2 type transport system permease protein